MKRIQFSLNVLLAISILAYLPVQAQNDADTEGRFAASLFLGTAFNDPSSWIFYSARDYHLVRIGFSGSVGLVYGPMTIVDHARLYVSTEVGFSEVHTAEVAAYRGTAQAKWKRLPLLLWTKLTTDNAVSPFVRLGIGATKVRFQELYTSLVSDNLDIDYWAFAWGGGAGLDWVPSHRIRLSFSVDYISAEATQARPSFSGNTRGILIRTVEVQAGVRTEFTF